MSEKSTSMQDHDEPGTYVIRLKGHLDDKWTDWFEGLAITLEEDGDTLITGPVVDQAALYGLLKKVRDLGLPLVSVCPIEPDRAEQSNAKSKNNISGLCIPNQSKKEKNDNN